MPRDVGVILGGEVCVYMTMNVNWSQILAIKANDVILSHASCHRGGVYHESLTSSHLKET